MRSMETTMKGSKMDDRRYMSYELRAIDDPRYRGKVTRRAEGTKTCFCGKTVYSHNGNKVSDSCPRHCETNRQETSQ